MEIVISKRSAKEKAIGALTIMDEDKAQQVWAYIQMIYSPNIWESFDEVEPTPDEIAALDARENGDPEYQPYIGLEDAMRELGLRP